MRDWTGLILQLRAQISMDVERGIAQAHKESVEAWRDGRSPMADPPAESPFFLMEVI